MTGLVVRKARSRGVTELKRVPVVRKEIRGGVGVVKLERVWVICPACGEQVEAVATDGRVKGYCAAAKQYVDFRIETQRVGTDKDNTAETKATALSSTAKKFWQDPEYRAKLSAATKKRWQDPEYRAKQSAAKTGKHPTAETRAKLSAALRRRHHNERGASERPD